MRIRASERLAAIAGNTDDQKLAAEGELLARPTLRRYLTRRASKRVIDTAAVVAEANRDSKLGFGSRMPRSAMICRGAARKLNFVGEHLPANLPIAFRALADEIAAAAPDPFLVLRYLN